MSPQRTIGLILLIVGLLLLVFGLNATDSVSDTVKEGLTGKHTDKTMLYIIGGGALAVAGLAMSYVGFGRPHSS